MRYDYDDAGTGHDGSRYCGPDYDDAGTGKELAAAAMTKVYCLYLKKVKGVDNYWLPGVWHIVTKKLKRETDANIITTDGAKYKKNGDCNAMYNQIEAVLVCEKRNLETKNDIELLLAALKETL